VTNRVLITGATGFAGRYLTANMVESGYRVTGLTGHHPELSPASIDDLVAVDLRDFRATQDAIREIAPSHVVHLAAISFVGHENVTEIYDTNIVGTRNLLKALAGLPDKPKAVLLTSSANVYCRRSAAGAC